MLGLAKSSSAASHVGTQSTFTISISSAYDFLVSFSTWVRSVQAGQCKSSLFSAACLALSSLLVTILNLSNL